MNLFGSKKEAWVMAGVAAFFVLVTLGFTLEPLVTVILAYRTIPLETTSLLVVSSNAKSADIVAAVGKKTVQSELMDKADDLLGRLGVRSVAIQATSFAIATKASPEGAVAKIRRFLSQLTPFDIKTILPDGTFMTETVIDPALIKVAAGDNIWTFSQTNPQIVVQKNGSKSNILVNNPQVGDIHGFESPIGCKITAPEIKTLTYEPKRKALVSTILTSFLAYFRDYSCFQSFSTFIKKS